MAEARKGVCIRIAGNTEIPALLALRAKGYRVWLEYAKVNDPKNPWHPYMPDYQAVGAAGESPVGDQSDRIAQPSADDGGSRGKHLAHPGAAFWSFITNHNDSARLDSPG